MYFQGFHSNFVLPVVKHQLLQDNSLLLGASMVALDKIWYVCNQVLIYPVRRITGISGKKRTHLE